MIKKAYEIQCDYCGCAQPDYGDKAHLVEIWIDQGWIIEGKLCFCSEVCKKMEKGEMEHEFN